MFYLPFPSLMGSSCTLKPSNASSLGMIQAKRGINVIIPLLKDVIFFESIYFLSLVETIFKAIGCVKMSLYSYLILSTSLIVVMTMEASLIKAVVRERSTQEDTKVLENLMCVSQYVSSSLGMTPNYCSVWEYGVIHVRIHMSSIVQGYICKFSSYVFLYCISFIIYEVCDSGIQLSIHIPPYSSSSVLSSSPPT